MNACFTDKTAPPGPDALAAALGDAYQLWCSILAWLEAEFPPMQPGWMFYGRESGWCLRLRQKSRTLLYLLPRPGGFAALFVFSEKAVQLACAQPLPPAVFQAIEEAHPYPEGRSFQVQASAPADLQTLQVLVKIKHAS